MHSHAQQSTTTLNKNKDSKPRSFPALRTTLTNLIEKSKKQEIKPRSFPALEIYIATFGHAFPLGWKKSKKVRKSTKNLILSLCFHLKPLRFSFLLK